MLLGVVRSRPWKLVILAGLAMAFALALPTSTAATSLNEVKKLTASDAGAGDFFGWSVAVSGDDAIVGALQPIAGTGAAYVFRRNEGRANNWGEVKKLTASDAQADDHFGVSVAVGGGTAVVGASSGDAGGSNAGSAYVFQRNEGGADNWGQVTKLTASDAQANDLFGGSVAVSGDTAVVGAMTEDAAGGINDDFGAAYVFQRNQGGAGNWGEVTKLAASDAEANDSFGHSVAASGDTAVVGAFREGSRGGFAGAAYVFQRDEGGAGNWGEVKKLLASDAEAGDRFGYSVAVSGDTAVVGAFGEGPGGGFAEAAYVFQRDEGGAGNWGEVKKLIASDAQASALFGTSVTVSGDTAVVGAVNAHAGVSVAGAAYLFQRNEGGADNWGETKKLTASNAEAGDMFGWSVAASGDTAVVGASGEDARGRGAGAAYVFDLLLPKSTPTPCAPEGCPTPTPAPLPGDVNCDGTVTSIDAALILQFNDALLGSLPCASGADLNGDGRISPLDATLILRFTAGLLDSLPPP